VGGEPLIALAMPTSAAQRAGVRTVRDNAMT
jgi:hypothetical protein